MVSIDLRREMNLLKANNSTKYLEVWEGHTKQTLDGAIYAEEIRQTLLTVGVAVFLMIQLSLFLPHGIWAILTRLLFGSFSE